jgi:EmrB/QacA subfamily drug resistance transporter
MHHHLDLRSKLIIMLSVMASLFLVALDQTIVSTALGKIVEEFNAFSSLSLIVTAYLLTTTVTVPIAGKLSDLFGRRVVLLTGVAVFLLGSLLSGLSQSIDQLVWFRALQGVGGGIITANAFTIVGDLFPPRERSKWQGLIGATFGLSSVIGPLLGGWLTDGQQFFNVTTDWRWAFYINVPIAIAAFVLIAIYSPRLKRDVRPRIDYLGAGLLSLALATLVLAVDNTETIFAGLLDATGLSLAGLRVIMGAIVIASVAGLIVVERRADEPVLPPSFFKRKNFVLTIIIAALFGAGFLGSILYLTQFNQQVFGASPTESGLMILPLIAGLMVSSIGSGRLISKLGHYKIFMQVGTVLAAVMVGMLALLTPDSSYLFEAILTLVLGFGLGLVMPVLTIAVQNEFKQSQLGIATSSVQLFRSLGSTVGTALFGAMLTAGLTTGLATIGDDAYLNSLKDSPVATRIGSLDDSNTLLTLNMPDIKTAISNGFEQNVSQLPGSAQSSARQEFYRSQSAYADKVTTAFSDSLRALFLTAAAMMALAALLVIPLKERELAQAAPVEPSH